MLTTEEILYMSVADIAHLNKYLAKKFARNCVKQIVWRTSLVVATHIVCKQIAKRIESRES